MNISIIGAGKVATHLSNALQYIGHNIIEVYSRTVLSATTLAHQLNCKAVTEIEELSVDSDLYVIALTDNALSTIIPSLCKGREKSIFVHTAGSISKDIFKDYAQHYGVFYPLQTFSLDREINFSEIPFFIESSDESTFLTLKHLANQLSSKVYELTDNNRQYLHLAAVFASNFTNHCYAIAQEILKEHQLPFEVLLPLIKETAQKIQILPPQQAQTGPAIRQDDNVMQKHLSLLADKPIISDIYKKCSQSIQILSKSHLEHDKL